ncbi:MAG: hypothetical protein KKD77_24455, partial [Gammaproteobacteria bacterium]|nr:hypothetical protein [Gammaproteobacteria bacterium]
ASPTAAGALGFAMGQKLGAQIRRSKMGAAESRATISRVNGAISKGAAGNPQRSAYHAGHARGVTAPLRSNPDNK